MSESNFKPGKPKVSRKMIIAAAGIAAVAVIAAGIFLFSSTDGENKEEVKKSSENLKDDFDNGRIYPNIFINNIDVGNMSKDEAEGKIEQEVKAPFEENEIIFTSNNEKNTFNYSQFKMEMNIKEIVDKAYNYAREGSKDERKSLYEKLKSGEKQMFEVGVLDKDGNLPDEVKTNIKNELESKLKEKVYIAPKNASMKKGSAGFERTKEAAGQEFDSEKAVNMVCDYITAKCLEKNLAKGDAKEFEIPVKEVPASVTYEQLLQVKDLIGKYSTKYSGSASSGRVINMKVAAGRINGSVVAPGETFSTNKALGETTPENGYKLAGAYINGKLDQDYGGGVCQISTTLYNAVLRAELAVVERSNHSLTVGYVPRGFDATLAGDYIDFKFKNDTEYPVYIESYMTSNQVIVNIYGKEIHPAGRTLEFRNDFSGGAYKTYKKVYQDGKFVEEVYLSKSVYKNLNGSSSATAREQTTQAAQATTEETTTKVVTEETPAKPPKTEQSTQSQNTESEAATTSPSAAPKSNENKPADSSGEIEKPRQNNGNEIEIPKTPEQNVPVVPDDEVMNGNVPM